jgi:hypothetical protein
MSDTSNINNWEKYKKKAKEQPWKRKPGMREAWENEEGITEEERKKRKKTPQSDDYSLYTWDRERKKRTGKGWGEP